MSVRSAATLPLQRLGRRLPPSLRRAVREPVVRRRFTGLGPADVLLVSYPKSGSTWLRSLLAQALTGTEPDHDRIRATVAPVGAHGAAPPLVGGQGRLLRTHEPLWPYRGVAGMGVVYLVRRPEAVCLSYLNHLRGQGRDLEVGAFVDAFLAGTVDGYGTWADHVVAAAAHARGPAPLTWVRYEDLRAHPVTTLASLLDRLGEARDESVVAEAVAANTPERMRERAASSAELARRRSRHPRPPEARGWTEAVDAGRRQRFARACAPGLAAAGYRAQADGDGPAGG